MYAITAYPQDSGSILIRARNNDLIVYGQVIGKSEPTMLCRPPILCQVVVLQVLEVVKGTYKPQFLRAIFFFGDFDRYTDKSENYVGLSRNLFDKGKKWLFVLNSSQTVNKCFSVSEDMEKYVDVRCIKVSLDSVIPADDEELELMKKFVKAIQP
jgi:hypothetical protein